MVLMIDLKQSESGCMNNLTVECYVSKLQFVRHTGSTSKMCMTQGVYLQHEVLLPARVVALDEHRR